MRLASGARPFGARNENASHAVFSVDRANACLAKAGPGRRDMENIVAASLALALLDLLGDPLQQAFRRRRQNQRVDGVMPIVGDANAADLLLALQSPGAAQLRGDGAGPREYAAFVGLGRKHSFQFVGEQPGRPLGVGQIAGAELVLDILGVLQLEVTLLQAPHFLETFDAGRKRLPVLRGFVLVEPFERCPPALMLIAGDATEGLVAVRIVAEPAPWQNVIHLIASVVGSEAIRRDAGVAINAFEILLLAQFVSQQFIGADGSAQGFRRLECAAILLFISILDALGQLGALFGAFADVAREFNIHLIDGPEGALDRSHLFDRFEKRAPRHGAVDVLQRNDRARRMIVADARASVGIAEPLRQSGKQGARRLGRNVSRAAKMPEVAPLCRLQKDMPNERLQRYFLQALADSGDVLAKGQHFGDAVELFGRLRQ